MIQVIASCQNKIIKHCKSLQTKKYRDSTNEFLIEGIKLLKEAIESNVKLTALLYHNEAAKDRDVQSIIKMCMEKNIVIYELHEKPYMDISETKTPQGVIGIGKKIDYNVNKLLRSNRFNIIIMEQVQDPGNVGTIIRTADAFGFDMVFLSKGCADVYSGKVIRSTMGSIFHIPIITDVSLESLLKKFIDLEVYTIAATPHTGLSCYDIEYGDRNAIIIGNESKGLSSNIMDMVKIKANIPMVGMAESLNAGIAAAIMMYEATRYKLKHR
ncbi:TrmH family RNA methyltransferase [Lutispora thermophila]|uniref:RNA methyltransferase, TrmH family n=1 Tax=Lutispora thermophila DSM 19022 TaxID=1122184 RepID=A0A1M6GNW3_9FIRM|nr:RNA methyltransferase [Lutispora thermophila]SHJ11657.1 RNA methyltransferase, TrmH family [Lutispora thermophila DSM 19022]